MKKKRLNKIQKLKEKPTWRLAKKSANNLYGFTITNEDIFGVYKEPEIKTEDIDYIEVIDSKLLGDGNNG